MRDTDYFWVIGGVTLGALGAIAVAVLGKKDATAAPLPGPAPALPPGTKTSAPTPVTPTSPAPAPSPAPRTTILESVPGPATPIPSSGCLTGSQYAAAFATMSVNQRETAIVEAVSRGCIPQFLRQFVAVDMPPVGGHTARIFVSPDYLSIGTDADFLRVPLKPGNAQRVADMLGGLLPTTKMVDAIAAQAAVKVTPRAFTPGSGGQPNVARDNIHFIVDAQQLAEQERAGRWGLVSGAKKDIIIDAEMRSSSKLDGSGNVKLWIYGWYYPTMAQAQASGVCAVGKQYIQSRSWVHDRNYVDYSHGIRLIALQMLVDGQQRNTADVLADPTLSPLLSAYGRISNPKYPV